MYLSAQNIIFQKGLTQKLIPKFIGPYKILWDYGNSSFKLELPNELKQRGVHDVFHLSLLWIHISNDDQLFPGWQENQLRLGPEVEEEWAVEEVLSHHGSKGDIIFELKWKSGDITWLPSHDIAHLQVLKNYLDAQGMDQINQLPPGKGNALLSNPQITLGFINLGFNAEESTITKIYKYLSNHILFPATSLSNLHFTTHQLTPYHYTHLHGKTTTFTTTD